MKTIKLYKNGKDIGYIIRKANHCSQPRSSRMDKMYNYTNRGTGLVFVCAPEAGITIGDFRNFLENQGVELKK